MVDDDDIWDAKRGMYFDRQGREINLREWVELSGKTGDEDARLAAIHVESDHVDDVWVSTVWIGINHNYLPDGPPLIFETMVFGGPLSHDQRRYSTEDQARLGHAEILAEVRAAAAGDPVREPDKNIVDALADALLEIDDD